MHETVWFQKYRPKTIQECILPKELKKTFQTFVDKKDLPNLLLSGPPGIGKTTVACAALNELGFDLFKINGSLEGRNIDIVRNEIADFASAISFTEGRKFILVDEADYCFDGKQTVKEWKNGKFEESACLETLVGNVIDVCYYDFEKGSAGITSGLVIYSGEKEVFEVEFDDGSKIYCTRDHNVFDDLGNTSTLEISKAISSVDLNHIDSRNELAMKIMKTVMKITSLGKRKVYDISTTTKHHNFVLANGVIAHNCNPQSVQPALRGFIEEFSVNCGFIFTCNYINRIIDALKSRCSVMEFSIPKDERMDIMKAHITRLTQILDTEKVPYDIKALAALVKSKFPDFRRILNELQRYSATGKIDIGIIAQLRDATMDELIEDLRGKKFDKMRAWAAHNSDMDFNVLVSKLYEILPGHLESRSIPQLVLYLADYSYKAAFVVNPEINLVAMLTEMMSGLTWKGS